MKKSLFAIAVIATLGTTSAMASEYETYGSISYGSVDGDSIKASPKGEQYGYSGSEQSPRYSIELGSMEVTEKNEFGNRFSINFTDHGEATTYSNEASNAGHYRFKEEQQSVTANYDLFFEINDHAKPYIGAGLGMTKDKINYGDTSTTGVRQGNTTTNDSLKVIGSARIGITGDIAKGFIYDLNVTKYAADDNFNTTAGDATDIKDTSFKPVDMMSETTINIGFGYKF